MGSLRSMGYSFESAVADVVDNSISAHAQNIRILFPPNPMDELALGILDDGDLAIQLVQSQLKVNVHAFSVLDVI